MLSCASSAPADHLTIHLAEHHPATLHVSTCVSDAPLKEIYLDGEGSGKTSLCPSVDHTVDIEIIDGNNRYTIPASEVQIRRTGDGIATSLEVHATR